MKDATLCELTTLAELEGVRVLEQAVWGVAEHELLAASHLRASLHAGALVVGAFVGEKLVGFAYGFPAYHPDATPAAGFHSHMLAVLPEGRGRGLGRALKAFQRRWCLRRKLRWMQWSFDPLQAKNARLNLEHLGAHAARYETDLYGPLGGSLNATLPTDRLVAHWPLDAPHVQALIRGRARPYPDDRAAPYVVRVDAQGGASGVQLARDEPLLRLEIPPDITPLLAAQPDRALSWRLTLREVMTHYLARGYRLERFRANSYLLNQNP